MIYKENSHGIRTYHSIKMKFVGALVVVILATKVEGAAKPPMCPSGMPPKNVKYTAEEISNFRRNTTSNLWSSPLILSKDADLLSKELISMSISSNKEQQILSSVATMWIFMYITTNNSATPDLCSFAKIINATSNWAETGSCADLSVPLKDAVYQIQFRTIAVFDAALNNTGCGKMINDKKENPKIIPKASKRQGSSPLKTFASNETCYANGFVYRINSILNYIGDGYSKEAKSIIRRLYKSDNMQDKLIALITLVTASAPLKSITDNYRNEMKYTFFSLGAQTKLPRYCCGKFRKNLSQIYRESLDENTRIYNATMKEFCPTG